MITIQFGDTDNQWVLQWSQLSSSQKLFIKHQLERHDTMKIIHNAMFECVMMLFNNVRIRNVYDTMLGEQVLWGGEHEIVSYGLDDVCWRRLKIDLDKTEQTTFGDDILTPNKVRYAAQDVRFLKLIQIEQFQECQQYGLENVVALENESVLAFAEMTFTGMEVDEPWWTNLEAEAYPIVEQARATLNAWLTHDELKAVGARWVVQQDRLEINWNSHKQIQEIFKVAFPDLPGTTKAVLKMHLKKCKAEKKATYSWLENYLEGDMEMVEEYLIHTKRAWLIDKGYFLPAGTSTINWNSRDQVLPLFAHLDPKIKDLSADTLGKFSHPIVLDFQHFKDSIKLINTYGSTWIKKNIEPDGRIRTRFNQVLTTGRVSSSGPNMQQIPAKEEMNNKYRNAFIPLPNTHFVSSDFVSQELMVIAYLSNDPVWLEALAKGQDLHSVTAELVHKRDWVNGTEAGCAYYKMEVNEDGVLVQAKKKCKCKKHKHYRSGIKTINFGLAYGMSKFKLAATLRCSVPEAQALIDDYFKEFPLIKRVLDYLGEYGVRNGHIKTISPFFRRRWFPLWPMYYRFIDTHIMGLQYHPGLGEIERASKNMPIQGASADMMKVALCLVYWEIHDVQHINHLVKMAMQVHDQLDTYCADHYKEIWSNRQNELMEEAGLFIVKSGIIKSETTITPRWSK